VEVQVFSPALPETSNDGKGDLGGSAFVDEEVAGRPPDRGMRRSVISTNRVTCSNCGADRDDLTPELLASEDNRRARAAVVAT
jgi:hypothetical protein